MPEAPTEYSLHDLCSMVDALEKRSTGLLRLIPSVGRGLAGLASKAKGFFGKAPAAAESAGAPAARGLMQGKGLFNTGAAPVAPAVTAAANAAKWNTRLGWGAGAAMGGQALVQTADQLGNFTNPIKNQQLGAEMAMTQMSKLPWYQRAAWAASPQWALQKYVDSRKPMGYMQSLAQTGISNPFDAYVNMVGHNSADLIARRTIDNIRAPGTPPLYPGVQQYYGGELQKDLVPAQLAAVSSNLSSQVQDLKKQLAALRGGAQPLP